MASSKKNAAPLLITGAIDEQVYEKVANHLLCAKHGNVTLQINSPGGTSLDSLAIFSLLKQYPGTVTTVAIGSCYSAAILIYAAGDLRLAARETWFMVHEDSFRVKGNTTQVRTEAAYGERLEHQWAQLMQEQTGIEARQWDTLSRATTYFTAADAFELGLVHKYCKRKP